VHRLRLFLLGPPRIERDDQIVEVDTRKAIALIAYLAVTRQRHRRDALAALFWPDYEQNRAYANLRRTLWALNKADVGELLDISAETLGLRRTPELWVDLDRFESRLAECRTHGHLETEVCPACAEPLTEATDLYRDDFLAGFTLRDSSSFDDWQFAQTERLRRELASALDRLVRHHSAQAQGELETAIVYARRWLALDPLHEPAHRHLMLLYAWSGQWSAAFRQYRECARLLERELGVPPHEETIQLYEDIKAGRPPLPEHLQSRPAASQERARPAPQDLQPGATTARIFSLPLQTTPFVGREQERAEIARLLLNPACNLLTLVGAGGIGKTRLAIQAADELAAAFPGGVAFIPLAPVSSTTFLVSTIANALLFSFYDGSDQKQQLLSYLREKNLLLVMDNFEHLLEGAELVQEMLTSAPGLKILATSLERLNLQEEWVLEVGGLAFPHKEQIVQVEDYSALQLFLQSAQRTHPGFVLSADVQPCATRICQLVGGMPLGIELAAAWMRVLSCGDIAEEIQQNLDFLSTSLRNVPERHRSIRAVFDYAWKLLSDDERTAFCALSVFRGGFRREAASAVAGASLPVLLSLVDRSLLRRDGAGRFEMLEAIRRYAEEKLLEAPGQHALIHDAHATHYAKFICERDEYLGMRQQDRIVREIDEEIENVRAGWRWAVERGNFQDIDTYLEGLFSFYEMRGWFVEGAEFFSRALDRFARPSAAASADPSTVEIIRGRVMARQGAFVYRLGSYQKARQLLRESLALFRELDDQQELTFCLNYLGDLARLMGDYQEAKRLLQESRAICERLGGSKRSLRAQINLGIVEAALGDFEQARRLFRESLTISNQIENVWGMLKALSNLGIVACLMHDYVEAQQLLEESLAIYEELEDPYGIAISLNNLGIAAYDLGQYAEAQRLHQRSLEIFKEIGYQTGVGLVLKDLGYVAIAMGQDGEARLYFLEALKVVLKMQTVPSALDVVLGVATLLAKQAAYEQALELLAFVVHHPAVEQDTKNRAMDLLARLEQSPVPVSWNASQERGKTRAFDEVIGEILQQQGGYFSSAVAR
jgi:predicted ATPase/DNA-binding SARP family transcriptional activator